MKIVKLKNVITIGELESTLDLGLQIELGEEHPKHATLLKVNLSAGGEPILPSDKSWYKSKAFEEKFVYIPDGVKGDIVEIPLLVGSKSFDEVRIELAPWKGGARDLTQVISSLVVSVGFGIVDDDKRSKNRLISIFKS